MNGAGADIRGRIKDKLTKRQNRRYDRELSKRRIPYSSWITDREREWRKCAALYSVKDDGELVWLTAGKGRLSDCAKELAAYYFEQHPEWLMAYGDEDVCAGGERKSPWFKPDWSPDLLNCSFYFGSVVVLRRSFFEKAAAIGEENRMELTKQQMEVLRNCAELAGGFKPNPEQRSAIGHIPHILFHADAETVWQDYLTDTSEKGRFAEGHEAAKESMTAGSPGRISVIIPSKDQPKALESCLLGIMREAIEGEVIIVDNGSTPKNRQRIEEMLRCRFGQIRVSFRYLYQPMEFNFSKMCNIGAAEAKEQTLLFLNDDVELCGNTLKKMQAMAERPYTGAVGLKLYYPASDRIQHTGITNLPMGPVHKLQFLKDSTVYYFDSNRGCRNVLAVTAACMMLKKSKFELAGGFPEELKVAFNDVSLCFKLYELGYANVCVNDRYAYHHESLSRGADEAEEKLERLLRERTLLYKLHPELNGKDPYYSEGLGRQGLDTRIRPAYETAGNFPVQPHGRLRIRELSAFRQDECLLVRIESAEDNLVQGYGVVLGDNNACYERALVLISEEQKPYIVPLKGQYRPDLIENMPDQKNTGLCGFWVKLTEENLPAGVYRAGMTARNRVTGLRLMNMTGRRITIKRLRNGEECEKNF